MRFHSTGTIKIPPAGVSWPGEVSVTSRSVRPTNPVEHHGGHRDKQAPMGDLPQYPGGEVDAPGRRSERGSTKPRRVWIWIIVVALVVGALVVYLGLEHSGVGLPGPRFH